MAKFLVRYLMITGICAAIAVSAPSLVVLGFFLLIVPGAVLLIAPTAFLLGAIFAAIWWPIRAIGTWPAALVALAGTAAVVIAIPWLANSQIQARIDALRAEDREAAGPVSFRGVIRFERTAYLVAQMEDPEWKAQVAAFNAERRSIDWSQRPVACDAMCAAALFTPGVEAVIVAPMLAPGAAPRTLARVSEFWIENAPGCTGSLTPERQAGNDGFTDYAALNDEWRVRISQGHCIRRGPVSRKPDVTIAIADWRVDGTTWSWTQARTSILRMEVRASSGEVLLRRTSVNTAKLDPVLWIIGNSDLSSFRFDWGRARPRGGEVPGAFTPADLLAEVTPLRVRADPRAVMDAVRSQLALALSDPARPRGDLAFAMPGPMFDDIDKNGLRPGDAELVERIISDPRTSHLGSISNVMRKMGPEAVRLRGPIVKRVLAARYPDDRETGVPQIGSALNALSAGTFATPTDDELRLLDDPDRRNWATGLVMRQADRGAAAVPILTRIVVEGWSRPLPEEKSRRTRNLDATYAARHGLCVLGPVAQSALPAIEALVAAGHMPQRELDELPWQLTLARLGRPIESFRSPPNHSWSDAQIQDSLRRRLARFSPERDC